MAQHFGSVVIEIAKLRDYCLSETHPRGRHKARVFRSRLGLGAEDAETVRQSLLDAVRDNPDHLNEGEKDAYGQRYFLDFELSTATGSAAVRSTWIVLAGEDVLRLTSCYVL